MEGVLSDWQAARLRDMGATGRLEYAFRLFDGAESLLGVALADAATDPRAEEARGEQGRPGPIERTTLWLAELATEDLPCAVAGRWALLMYGVPGARAHVDLLVDGSGLDTERFTDQLTSSQAVVHAVRAPSPGRYEIICELPEAVEVQLDLVAGDAEVRAQLSRAHTIPLGTHALPVLTAEDLLLRELVARRISGHSQDQALVTLVRGCGRELDVRYLREHCSVHRVCGQLEDVLREAGHPAAEG